MIVVKLFLLYITVANTIKSEKHFNWLMAGLMIATMFEVFIGIYQGGKGTPYRDLGAKSHLFFFDKGIERGENAGAFEIEPGLIQ